MKWTYLNTVYDILNLQKTYNNFEDSEIISFKFESGNYVDENLIGQEYMTNNFYMIFQRMDLNPFSIELVFEEMRRINLYTPLMDEYPSSINFAKLIKNDEFIYWTKWKDFDPYNKDHLKEDFTFIEARRAKWRIVS